mgnify:CR=1 FL=1
MVINLNKITSIFYKEIVPEAATGHIECLFIYNMPFNTNIEGKMIKSKKKKHLSIPTLTIKKKHLFIPTLMIKNKIEFDYLLTEYVEKIMKFHDTSGLDEKTILTLLWSNATSEDFQDPINYLKKRIAFIDDQNLSEVISNFNLVESEILKSVIEVKLEKSEVFNETPYRIKITLKSDVGEEYELPAIYMGIFENKAYVYAIQNDKEFRINNGYQKKIKRLLYGIDEGLDVLNETRENYDFGNLKDVTSSFVLTANILMGILNKIGIEEVIVPSILTIRWNAKEMKYDYIKETKKADAVAIKNMRIEHENIQRNLTEKLTRTFLRLCHHHSGIYVTSYPMELDSSLHLTIDENNQCNNPILAETYNLFKGKQR